MGTRSTITFYEKRKDKIIPIVNIYQQYDGYLEGVGKVLCEWLKNKILVNGFTPYDVENVANGVGCLTAQFIEQNKKGIGNLYLYPIGECQDYCDYNYSVIIEDVYERRRVKDIAVIEVGNWGKKPFFKGTVQELLDYIEKQKEEDT